MKRIAVLAILLAIGSTTDRNATADTYDVYLLAGQSNMDGRGSAEKLSPAQRQPSENAIIYYRNPPHSSDGWVPLIPGYSIPPKYKGVKYKGKLPSPTFGPEIGFTEAMLKADPTTKLALIKGSKGGTNLRVDWKPGKKDDPESQGERYRFFVETIRTALEKLTQDGHQFRIRGLLWHQGEGDSKSSAAKYEGRLREFIDRIREDIGVAELPVIVGEVFDNGKRDGVREAVNSIGASGPLFGVVSSEGTTTWDPGTHFDARSQILMGQRYADAVLSIIGEKASP